MWALHASYSHDEIIAELNRDGIAEPYCDGQFLVQSNHVVCLFEIDPASNGSYLPTPRSINWRPKRLDYAPGNRFPWIPDIVTEVYDYSGSEPRKIRDYHSFLRTPSDAKYLYAGTAELGSWGQFPDRRTGESVAEASFTLDAKLTRDLWIRFGGCPGWIVEVNHVSRPVAVGDVEAFRELTVAMLKEPYSHLSMTRYEEDTLHVHTNARRGWLMYLSEPADSGLYLRGSGRSGWFKRKERFRCGCGIDLEFPASQTVPREDALQLAEEFFRMGTLSQTVPWTTEF
jgi:hypothetical protein